MKKLILILTFLFPVSSFADWIEVNSTKDGDTFYLDFFSVKERNGLVYYWSLIDFLKPTSTGALSVKSLQEVNCNIPRKERELPASYFSSPMGKGTPLVTYNKERPWRDSQPDTILKFMINQVCEVNDVNKDICASPVKAKSDLCINRK